MAHTKDIARTQGFTVVELLVVVSVLGVCLAVGSAAAFTCLGRHEARGAAQAWQAAAAWAQTGVLWQGGAATVSLDSGSYSVVHDGARCGGLLQEAVPAVAVQTNVPRWASRGGTTVRFVGELAAPDSGGSLYFTWATGSYRVVVRPVSGLTARSIQAR